MSEEKTEVKNDDIVLDVHDGFIGFDEIEERAARRRNEELKQQEESNGKASS